MGVVVTVDVFVLFVFDGTGVVVVACVVGCAVAPALMLGSTNPAFEKQPSHETFLKEVLMNQQKKGNGNDLSND